MSVFLSWRPTLHTKAHATFDPNLQLLTYYNVQRAVQVKLLLKSKREKREFDNRHLMHVIILLNTILVIVLTRAAPALQYHFLFFF